MMDVESHDQFIKNNGKSVWTWGCKHFDKILNIYLDKNWMSTLATGLNIFMPVSRMSLISKLNLFIFSSFSDLFYFMNLNFTTGFPIAAFL